jgi:ABC-2 type transport system permease protein
MRKLLALIWRELYTTYTDRNAVLIMIATPLALASIIGLAFGGFIRGGNDVPIRDIPVIVVNQDEGAETGDTTFNNGQIFVDLLAPSADTPPSDDTQALLDLTNAVVMDDPAAARAAVDKGDYAAAIIIPPDFSQRVTISQEHLDIEPSSIEVYGSPAAAISANIIRSIVEQIGNRIATGNITIAATIQTLIAQIEQTPSTGIAALTRFQPDFSQAFTTTGLPIQIEQQTVTGQAAGFNPLVYFGAAQAVFFMMFTAQGGATSLLEERRDGTLQRLLVTPTPRIVILLGKLAGTFVTAVFQLLLLFLFLTLIGSAMAGQLQFIWGHNVGLIALTIVASAAAACGLGAIITAIARTPEQSNIIGGAVIMAMGIVGGTFFNAASIPALQALSRVTINFWATQAFSKLAGDQTDVGTNLLVLLGLGIVMFTIGTVLFDRRLEE